MKIRTYLVVMALSIIVPITAFSTIAIGMLQRAQRAAAFQALHEAARATALAVDRELMSSEAALRVLAASPTLAEGNLRRFYEQAQVADFGPDTWTVLFDSRARELLNTKVPFGSALPSPLRGAERIRHVTDTQQTFVTNVIIGAVTRKPITAILVPVPAGQGKAYVLAHSFADSYFARVLAGVRHDASWTVGIVDRQGRFVARTQRPTEFVGQPARPEAVRAAARSNEGEIRFDTMEDVDSEAVFTHSAVSGWTIVVAAPTVGIEGPMQRAFRVMIAGMIAAIVLALLCASFFGRRLITSIRHASGLARLLAAGEVLRPRHSGVAEVDLLHAALHDAAAVLDQEKHAREVAQAERERLLASEHSARLFAEEQNRAKDEFLSMLGHELRNPLSAISAGVQVAEQLASPGPIERVHEIIRRQSNHLARIVDDLLDVGRMRAGKITLVKTPIDLASAARACVDALATSGRLQHHAMHLDMASVWVDADPARIDQIINNLLVNAVKYTPAGGDISVTTQADGDHAVLVVRDSGVGIPVQLLQRVFEPFVQGERSLDRAEGGLGIGLTLVRELAELHGGQVSVESPGVGRGSVFTVVLPRIAVARRAEPDRVVVAQPHACRVLLVEDNVDAREATSAMLELFGYDVLPAASGAEAIRLAQAAKPVVAVVDIGLPDMSGYEVAKRLRADQATTHVALIALTGYGLEADKQRALDAGFDMHLSKPVNGPRLKEAIDRYAAATPAS